eukprot:1152667-Prymnesium_polylepis.1
MAALNAAVLAPHRAGLLLDADGRVLGLLGGAVRKQCGVFWASCAIVLLCGLGTMVCGSRSSSRGMRSRARCQSSTGSSTRSPCLPVPSSTANLSTWRIGSLPHASLWPVHRPRWRRHQRDEVASLLPFWNDVRCTVARTTAGVDE